MRSADSSALGLRLSPAAAEKRAISEMYRREFRIPADQKQPTDENWTGAEIKACCRLAALLDLPLEETAQQIVPVAVTANEAIENLRTWASGRCLTSNAVDVRHRAHRRSGDASKAISRRTESTRNEVLMMRISPSAHSRSRRELATVLTALRHWQRAVPEKDARAYSPMHFKSDPPLSNVEIDALCETLNCGPQTDPFHDAIQQIRAILWSSDDRWDPNKSWNSETVEYVAGVLEGLGLKPR